MALFYFNQAAANGGAGTLANPFNQAALNAAIAAGTFRVGGADELGFLNGGTSTLVLSAANASGTVITNVSGANTLRISETVLDSNTDLNLTSVSAGSGTLAVRNGAGNQIFLVNTNSSITANAADLSGAIVAGSGTVQVQNLQTAAGLGANLASIDPATFTASASLTGNATFTGDLGSADTTISASTARTFNFSPAGSGLNPTNTFNPGSIVVGDNVTFATAAGQLQQVSLRNISTTGTGTILLTDLQNTGFVDLGGLSGNVVSNTTASVTLANGVDFGPHTFSIANGQILTTAGATTDDLNSATFNGPGAIRHTTNGGATQGFQNIRVFTTGSSILALQGNDLPTNVQTGSGRENIRTGGANDTIQAGSGADTIVTGNGTNFVKAGAGADLITLGTGSDFVEGGGGNDTVNASAGGANYITDSTGSDQITGGAGNDTILPGANADTIVGGGGNDSIGAGSGADRVTTTGGNDSIVGGGGNDTIISGGGSDTIDGGEANDQITAGAGADSVAGGNGDDIFLIAGGDQVAGDSIDGGAGTDSVRFTGAGPVTAVFDFDLISGVLNLQNAGDNLGQNRVVTFNGISETTPQTVVANFNDSTTGTITFVNTAASTTTTFNITGGGANDILFGSNGNDTITSGNGDDDLTGSLGADTLNGGAGADEFFYANTAELVSGGAFIDSVVGGPATDRIVLSADAAYTVQNTDSFARVQTVEEIRTFGAKSQPISLSLDATAFTTAGIRTINLSTDTNPAAVNVVNVSEAVAGQNIIITGSIGVDQITGGAGNDTLAGEAGIDVINMGTGTSQLNVLNGVSAAANRDVVTNFTVGTDVLGLAASETTVATAVGAQGVGEDEAAAAANANGATYNIGTLTAANTNTLDFITLDTATLTNLANSTLATATDGTGLLQALVQAGVGSTASGITFNNAGDQAYIITDDGTTGYLFHADSGANAEAVAAEINLMGTFSLTALDGIVPAQTVMI